MAKQHSSPGFLSWKGPVWGVGADLSEALGPEAALQLGPNPSSPPGHSRSCYSMLPVLTGARIAGDLSAVRAGGLHDFGDSTVEAGIWQAG